jgi:hypothetical protein
MERGMENMPVSLLKLYGDKITLSYLKYHGWKTDAICLKFSASEITSGGRIACKVQVSIGNAQLTMDNAELAISNKQQAIGKANGLLLCVTTCFTNITGLYKRAKGYFLHLTAYSECVTTCFADVTG